MAKNRRCDVARESKHFANLNGITARMIAGALRACLYPCGLPTCGVALQKREERKRGRREQSEERKRGRREQSKADQGGVEPPHKAVKANQGFAKSYATSNAQLVLYYFSAALLDAALHPLRPVRYWYYFHRSASPASDTTAATTTSAAATTAAAGAAAAL